MLDNPNILTTVFIIPMLNALVVLYNVFVNVGFPGAFGFAIIGLTVGIRLVLHPFFKQYTESAKKMQELKPKLDAIKTKHKKDVQKIQKEQMRLYQEAGINPASGCLVMIIQIAIFLSFYNTLMFFLMTQDNLVEKINASLYSSALHIENLDLSFFGFDLASTPHMGPWWYISIPVVTALFQFLQANAMSAMSGMMSVPTSQKDGKKDDMPNFQQIFATQMKYVFPFMIGFASYNLPIGLALYWNILSIFSIIQYRGGDIWIKTKSSLNKPKILLEESSTTSTLK